MKKFIFKSIFFILYFFIVTFSVALFLKYTNLYIHYVNGSEVYHSINKSKQKKQTKKLLLGDSVGNQLFSNITNNDTINSLACNQAIGLVGHFLLLNNYLKAGNQIDIVYLLYGPKSFKNNLDEIYTYHYFLKPFYKEEYQPLFTENVNNQIHKLPYNRLRGIPYILTSNWAPKFVSKDEIGYTFLSPISAEYLLKIKELSIEHKFKLIIVPPPISFKKQLTINSTLTD